MEALPPHLILFLSYEVVKKDIIPIGSYLYHTKRTMFDTIP